MPEQAEHPDKNDPLWIAFEKWMEANPVVFVSRKHKFQCFDAFKEGYKMARAKYKTAAKKG